MECLTKKTKKTSFIGGPGTGKTTLVKQLDVDYSLAGYNSSVSLEFARSYIRRFGPPTSIFEQILIYEGQKQLESELSHCDIIFCDNSSILNYIYGLIRCDLKNPKEVYSLMKLYEWAMNDLQDYELFYIPREFHMEQDGVIYQTEELAIQVDKKIKAFLDMMKLPYTVITGDVPARIKAVKEKLGFVTKRECKIL